MMHQRQFLQREGRGRVPEAAPSARCTPSLARRSLFLFPRELLLFKALQLVPFPTASEDNSSFLSRLLPGAWLAARPGLETRAAGGTGRRAPGAAATWPPEPAPCRWSLVGRPGPLRARSPVSPHPHRGRPPRLPTPWSGGASRDSKDTDGGSCGGGAGGSGRDFSLSFTPPG